MVEKWDRNGGEMEKWWRKGGKKIPASGGKQGFASC